MKKKEIYSITQGKVHYKGIAKEHTVTDGPEERVRCRVVNDLINKYKYPPKRIDINVLVPRRKPSDYADVVVFSNDQLTEPYIVIETKEPRIPERERLQAIEQGFGNANSLRAKYMLFDNDVTHTAFNVAGFPATERIKNIIADIPISYGKTPKYQYKKGDKVWDLSKIDFHQLDRKFSSCHDALWEGGKRDPSEAFDEMSKLMFAKIYDERFTKTGSYYGFQVGTNETTEMVASRIRDIYKQAQSREPVIFRGELVASDSRILEVVEILQGVSLIHTDLDAKGRAFENFLSEIFRGKLGQYFTRREIVDFVVRMVDPDHEDIVIDPACGSSGFLLYCMSYVKDKVKRDFAQDEETIQRISWEFSHKQVYGIEVNDRIARIAMMDMVIHEDGHTNIECENALVDYGHFDPRKGIVPGRFTVVLTNPPFGSKIKDKDVPLDNYELGSKIVKRATQKSETLFIERCLDLLEHKGRMGIVLPNGILNNPNKNDRRAREYILNNAIVKAIVALPHFAFLPAKAMTRASLVFLEKCKPEEIPEDYEIFMAIADHIGYDSTGRKDPKNDLPSILDEFRKMGGWER